MNKKIILLAIFSVLSLFVSNESFAQVSIISVSETITESNYVDIFLKNIPERYKNSSFSGVFQDGTNNKYAISRKISSNISFSREKALESGKSMIKKYGSSGGYQLKKEQTFNRSDKRYETYILLLIKEASAEELAKAKIAFDKSQQSKYNDCSTISECSKKGLELVSFRNAQVDHPDSREYKEKINQKIEALQTKIKNIETAEKKEQETTDAYKKSEDVKYDTCTDITNCESKINELNNILSKQTDTTKKSTIQGKIEILTGKKQKFEKEKEEQTKTQEIAKAYTDSQDTKHNTCTDIADCDSKISELENFRDVQADAAKKTEIQGKIDALATKKTELENKENKEEDETTDNQQDENNKDQETTDKTDVSAPDTDTNNNDQTEKKETIEPVSKSCNLIAPKSCFQKKPNSNIQTFNSNPHCNDENPRGTKIFLIDTDNDKKILTFLKEDKDLSYEIHKYIKVSELQSFLNEKTYTETIISSDGKYCDPDKSFSDGKYGLCTEAAFNEYLKKKCKEEEEKNYKISVEIIDADDSSIKIEGIKISIKEDTSAKTATSSASGLTTIKPIISKNSYTILAAENEQYEANSGTIIKPTTNITIKLKKKENTPNNQDEPKTKPTNPAGWNENMLRPKFQTGANWQERAYKGDASDITYWLQKFGGKITGLLSAIAVLIIAYNGFLITTAGSDDDTLTKAKTSIKWALLGLVGLNFVYLIVKTVISIPF